jgi:PrtD family type I secretion system ABC transporter
MARPTRNRLSGALRSASGAFVIAGLFSLFINLSMLIAPLYMMQVYDRVLASRSIETLIMLTVLAAGLLLVAMLVEIARSRVLVRVGARLDTALSSGLFSDTVGLRPRGEDSAASQPLRDLEALRTFLTGAGVLALFDAPWTPIFLAILFLFHPLLGAIALGGGVIIFAIAYLSERIVRAPLAQAGVSTRWSNQLVDAFARESDVVRVMGMVDKLRDHWRTHHESGLAWQALASDRLAALQAIAKTVRVFLQIAVLGVGAYLSIIGELSPGVMVAASIIMGRALAPVEAALGQWRGFLNARSAYGRLKASLKTDAASSQRTALPAPLGALEVDAVYFRMAGRQAPLLAGVSFELEAGESLGLIGPSGAGKSTLARLLVGAYGPASGFVRVDGAAIADWPKEGVGAHLGYLPQDVELFTGTVAQNICRFGEPDSAKIVEAAKRSGAHDMIVRLPGGYETEVGNGGRLLSGGQRQRIGLARAIYGEVRLVVLDEPNANLDADGENAVRQMLLSLKEAKRTAIVIAHKPSLMATVDKVLVLQDGKVELFGPRDKVMAALARAAGAQPLQRKSAQPENAAELFSEAQTTTGS